MSSANVAPKMTLCIPTDQALLAAVGRVALLHAQLDLILKMTIKTLGAVSIEEALDATKRKGPATLRKRIEALAAERLGGDDALAELRELLARAKAAAEDRHWLLHGVCVRRPGDGMTGIVTEDRTWRPLPTVAELDELARRIAAVTRELNESRLSGSIDRALASRAGLLKQNSRGDQ